MFDPNKLSYPRLEDGVVLNGPEDWPPAKLAALQRLSERAEPAAEPPAETEPKPAKPRRGRPPKKAAE